MGGDKIHLKRDRRIEIETQQLIVKASERVRMETPLLEVTGDLKINTDTDVCQHGRMAGKLQPAHASICWQRN
jgi:phage gp45-like